MSAVAIHPDLFGAPAIAGLSQAPAFVSPEEEQRLVAAIDASGLAPFQFHEWLGKRLTASFGWRYDFGDASLTRTAPIPEWLLPVRVRAATFAGIAADDFVQCLVIRYDPGSGIGWHRDRPVFEHVVGISLGSATAMRFRRRRAQGFERTSARLEPRSIYHLTGEARHLWEHSIAPLAETRWSVTFRSLSDKGRRLVS
jgi:DNA oxidative demethylase